MSSFGKRLMSFRKHNLQLTRKQFSDMFSISAVTLRSWENSHVQISERHLIGLKIKLIEKGTTEYDLKWLFEEDYLTAPTTFPDNENINKTFQESKKYVIPNNTYEPLLKKDSELFIELVSLTDLKCPCLGAVKDLQENMHFGVITQTINEKFCIHVYQGKPYTVYIENTFKVYLVKKIVV